jgi:cytochrome c553
MVLKKAGGLLLALVLACASDLGFSENLQTGKQKVEDERCAECHGIDGNIHASNESARIPKLAGQRPEYLLKQFQDFRNGERHNDFMALMARNLDDAGVVDIIAWYAAQPVMRGTGPANGRASLQGEKLYRDGDASRGILACAGCHGVDGKGVENSPATYPELEPELIPIIAGQDWHYLDQQLRDWRSGARTNSVGAVMNKVTKNLTDAEINALNDFISTLR